MGHRPASTPPVVLDSGATTNTSTTLDSAEEEETNSNHSSITKQRYLTYLTFTDGDDVQVDAPKDIADIPGSSLESTSKNLWMKQEFICVLLVSSDINPSYTCTCTLTLSICVHIHI